MLKTGQRIMVQLLLHWMKTQLYTRMCQVHFAMVMNQLLSVLMDLIGNINGTVHTTITIMQEKLSKVQLTKILSRMKTNNIRIIIVK